MTGSLVSEVRTTVREPSPVDPTHGPTRVDVVRQFSVDQAIKGATASGSIEVRWVESSQVEVTSGSSVDTTYDTLPLQIGTTYVLFLRTAADPATGPYWGLTGEPGIAALKGNDLNFITTSDYRRDLAQRKIAMGRAGAPPAFDITLAAVAALPSAPVASPGSTSPRSEREQALGTFLAKLPQFSSPQQVRDSLGALGLDGDAATDPGFCRKLEDLIATGGTVGPVRLGCTP